MRRLIEDPRFLDSAVVLLATGFVIGAYFTAYAYVHIPGGVDDAARTAGVIIVNASWALLTLLLFAGFAIGLRAGRSWNRALPDGYTGTFAAALVFGAAWIVDDAFWSVAFGRQGLGLEQLFTPPHLVEIAASAVIVSGPLRAASRRGESVAGPVTLTSSALLLSVFTFATQFIHPLIDPWAAADYQFINSTPAWLGENVGVASILVQAAILAGTGLLLNSAFRLRPGSLTFVFTLNGLLVTVTKGTFELLPVAVVTGVAADLWLAFQARRPGKPSASLCAVVGGTFATAYLGEILLLPAGTKWGTSLIAGSIIGATMLTWIMGRLLRAGLPATVFEPYAWLGEQSVEVEAAADVEEERWTLDPSSTARERLVRAALDDLGTPEALARSPLARLPVISRNGSAANDLRELLVDVISELAVSASPREAEAGRLLLDYYIKKVGSHEVIMERIHLSRPTYYRRLHQGFELVAGRVDRLSLGERVPVGE